MSLSNTRMHVRVQQYFHARDPGQWARDAHRKQTMWSTCNLVVYGV